MVEAADSKGKPYQDPTALTTDLVDKAVATEREISNAQREITTARFEGLELRLDHLQKWFDTIPQTVSEITQTKEQIKALTATVEANKTAVNERFQLSDIQTEKAARDVKSAVDAAFAASKEAVGEQNKANSASIAKSEGSFIKAVDQLSDTVKLNTKTTDDKIDDLKGRLVAMEGRSSVADPAMAAMVTRLDEAVRGLTRGDSIGSGRRQGISDVGGVVLGAVAVLSLIALVASIFIHVSH